MSAAKDVIRIGSRGSRLALVQAEYVAEELRQQGFRVEIVRIRTTGDRIRNVPLSQLGGKGVFVKEIEEALLRGEVQLAVHSLKDLPTELPEGLCLAAVPPRESPLDVLIVRRASCVGEGESATPLDRLAMGAKVGTSSPRRAAQLLHLRPDLKMLPLRGNLDTRLRKLDSTSLDAIVVAAAGLHRLAEGIGFGTDDPSGAILECPLLPEICTPAAAQGALGIEARNDDEAAMGAARLLEDASARRCVEAERAFLKALGGGCRVPIGALAEEAGGSLTLVGVICSIDGERLVRGRLVGQAGEPEELGIGLAEQLLRAGGGEIIRTVEQQLQGP